MLNPNPTELLEIRQELQRKRNESLEENRRKKIEEIFAKRRSQVAKEKSSFENLIEEWQKREYTQNDFPELFNAINSDDLRQQHFGIIGIRRLLAQGEEFLIQKVIDTHMIPRLFSFTERNEHLKLQLESSWVLANMTAGTTQQIQSLVTKGGIPTFERLLKHENAEICEQAILGIGNMAGDCSQLRDRILTSSNALRLIMDIVERFDNQLLVQKGTWALSNLVRGKPLPEFELVKETIPTFSRVIQHTQDKETLSDASWALSYLSEKGVELVLLETDICPAIVAHIRMDQNLATLVPLVRILGNLLSGNEEQANRVLEVPDIISKLVELATRHEKRAIIREVCWCLSNLTAGTSEQIEMLIQNYEHVASLMQLSKHSHPDVAKEVLYIFSNAVSRVSPTQIVALCQRNLIDFFVHYLRLNDVQNIKTALDAIQNVLNIGALLAHQGNNLENPFLTILEDLGGIELLENLQTHPENEVYLIVMKILETHFELENQY